MSNTTHPKSAIAMIAAVARNSVIGRGNTLPWHMPSDLAHFKAMTIGKPMIMGRKQFQSVGRPLPGRENIVVSRSLELSEKFMGSTLHLASDLNAALELARRYAALNGASEIMIIGGGEIYAQAMPLADILYITEIPAEVDGDVRFPAIDVVRWRETERRPLTTGPKDQFACVEVVTYRRIG